MNRRTLAATAGGATGAALLVAALALSPARPDGFAVGLLVLGVLVPASAAAATSAALRLTGADEAPAAARLSALGAPMLTVLILFVANLAAGLDHLGVQQATAVVLGTAAAAGLAARFTDPEATDAR